MEPLTINDNETIWLAEAIAELTGESVTEVIRVALQERLERLPQIKASPEEALEIAREISRLAKKPIIDHAELLYGENGLPK